VIEINWALGKSTTCVGIDPGTHIRADNLNNVKSLNTTTRKHGHMHTHNVLEIFYRLTGAAVGGLHFSFAFQGEASMHQVTVF